MAKKSRPDKPPDELKREIARSREIVARDFRGLRYELDIPRKIRRSFRQQTAVWIGAAVVVGVLLVLLPMRKKKVYVDARTGKKSKGNVLEAGFALGALKLAATLLKPVVIKFVQSKMGGNARAARPAKKP